MGFPMGQNPGLSHYMEEYNRGPGQKPVEDMENNPGVPKLKHEDEVLQNMFKGAAKTPHFFDTNFEERFRTPSEADSPLKQKTEEDSRLDFLLRMQNTMSETFDNTAYLNPHGLTGFDYKSIPDSQKLRLEKLKMRARRDNYIYMKQHPELDALMALFIQRILKSQPKDPIKFTAEFFTFKRSSMEQMVIQVDEEKDKLQRYHRVAPWKPAALSWAFKGFKSVNEVKRLSVGALADNFEFTPPPSPPKPVVQPTKKFYCGCKDKSRRATSHRPKLSGAKKSLLPEYWKGEAGEDALADPEFLVDRNYFAELEEESGTPAEIDYDGDGDTSNEEAFTDDEEVIGLSAVKQK